MVDARLRVEWLGQIRFDNLSDTGWRVFTGALMWAVNNGTNGSIGSRYLRCLHPDGEQPAAFEELLAAGLWVATETGYQLVDWDGFLGQSTAAQVEAHMENGRRRQRAWREEQRKKLVAGYPDPAAQGLTEPSVTGDVTRDVTRYVGEGEGEGEGEEEERDENEISEPVTHSQTESRENQARVCVVCGNPLAPVLTDDVHPGCWPDPEDDDDPEAAAYDAEWDALADTATGEVD